MVSVPNVDNIWYIIKNNNNDDDIEKKLGVKTKKIWKEVEEIPKNIDPKDILIIPGHVFVKIQCLKKNPINLKNKKTYNR